MSLKKWNVKKHVENIHGIKNYGNANIKRVNIDQQNMRQPEIHTKSECPIQHQHDVIPHYQSKYQPSQEDHQCIVKDLKMHQLSIQRMILIILQLLI